MNSTSDLQDAGAEPRSTTIPGDRGPAAVTRRAPLQARLQNALALGVVVLVGGGFLTWYYLGLAESRAEATPKPPAAQVRSESKLPPLGPVPKPAPAAVGTGLVDEDGEQARRLLASAPDMEIDEYGEVSASPAASQPPSAPAVPDPVLKRRLEAPVLVRAPEQYATPPLLVAEREDRGEGEARVAAVPARGNGTEFEQLLKPSVATATVAGVLPERRFLLSKGAVIDCTLETAIDSTLPGMTTCVTATDVWSADGAVVLLERGTRLVGETRSGVAQGQQRLFVLWGEARTPTGVVVSLASPGTDALGRSGLTGVVDTHFEARFGAAILVSLIDAAAAAVVAAQNEGGDSVIVSSQGAQDVMGEILQHTINVPPTIRVAQGERVSVLVARDADFARVYSLVAAESRAPAAR